MADLTIVEAIKRIENFPEKAAKECVEIMRDEFSSHNRTGRTSASMHYEYEGKSTYFVGVSNAQAEAAGYVQNGRGVARPIRAKALHWVENGQDIFRMRTGPVKGDDYIGRTVSAIRRHDFTL